MRLEVSCRTTPSFCATSTRCGPFAICYLLFVMRFAPEDVRTIARILARPIPLCPHNSRPNSL